MRRSSLVLIGAIASFALLVAAAPAPAPEDYVARILAEREKSDRSVREKPTSPFTPVAVRMVREGERTVVGVCGGEFKFDAAVGCAALTTLTWNGRAFRLVGADGSEAEPEAPQPVGRFWLSLSRQEDRGRILVHDPESPSRKAFQHYFWFPPDPAFRVEARLEPFAEQTPVRLGTTAGLMKSYRRYAQVSFEVGGARKVLAAFLAEGDDPADPSAFFIPFRDATSGKETYAVGRYASLEKGPDGRLFLDFNLAGNPNCAYNPYWNCPIPPAENVLDVAIRAGELAYPHPEGAAH